MSRKEAVGHRTFFSFNFMCGNFNAGPKRHVLLSTDGSQLVLTRRETRVTFGHKILSDAKTMEGQHISRSLDNNERSFA